MECKNAQKIVLGQRYPKLEEYVRGLSVGRSHTQLRDALRTALNEAAKEKVAKERKKELLPGLQRMVTLLQVFVFKRVFSDESELEKMIPEEAHRCLVMYVLDSAGELFETGEIADSLRDLLQRQLVGLQESEKRLASLGKSEEGLGEARRQLVEDRRSREANVSLLNNFNEIVRIIRGVVDELE